MDEKMLAMFKEKEQQNRFTAYNHIEMVMIEQDHAIFRLNICPESKNSFGMVHGGAIYAMADNATGFAAHTDGRNYVTQTTSSATSRRARSRRTQECVTGAAPPVWWQWTFWARTKRCWPPENSHSSAWT